MRPAQAVINLAALKHNYLLAKQLTQAKALAVVKADAYGHGSIRCAQALHEADGFAVAFLEEALVLRAAGVTQPILLLEGFFVKDELALIAEYDLWTAVHSAWQLEAINQAQLSRPIQCWLKMDSGMHRMGFAPEEYKKAWQALNASPNVSNIVLMTHLSQADEVEQPRTKEQLITFNAARAGLNSAVSMRNSPGILAWPELPSDWVRPGIMLYGCSPFEEPQAPANALIPVMTLASQIIGVRELAAGEPVGYGARYITPSSTRVGIVAMGYADGYPRQVDSGTPVAVCGQLTKIIGRVSMDMLAVDITTIAEATLGSPVELWGKQVSAEVIARAANTISYQLFCNLKRVPRYYLE
ncbi:alanine racemase [Pseudomonas sp. F1_0610]|uniref:alanine racemase n=1 Tax=Pseudomonas sp. F1_0610 TaxID=3114284 RepID=UPI0039C42CEE